MTSLKLVVAQSKNIMPQNRFISLFSAYIIPNKQERLYMGNIRQTDSIFLRFLKENILTVYDRKF